MIDIGDIFADHIRPRWVTGLNKVVSPSLQGAEAWLLGGTYSWLPSTAGTLQLDASNTMDALADAFASEIARFSCAAYESLLDAEPRNQDARSLGWTLVRHYYATFYAAHAILRISGTAITMISPHTASTLNRVGGQYLGMNPQVTSGLHTFQVHQSAPNRLVLRKIGGGNGGSHEEMWKTFLALLEQLEHQIVLTQGHDPNAISAVQVLTSLRTQLCRQGKVNGAWPSTIRNNINYRHDYGVWYPYKLTNKASTQLLSRLARWAPNEVDGYDIGHSVDDLSCFVDICNVSIRLLTSSLGDIARRSTKPKSGFVDRQPFKLLRLRRLQIQ